MVEKIDTPTLAVLNILMLVILAALIWGFKVIYLTALVAAPLMLIGLVLLTLGLKSAD